MHIILLRELVHQQLRVVALGVHDGLDELLEQQVDDAVTSQIDIDDIAGSVKALLSQGAASPISTGRKRVNAIDETALEASLHDFVFMVGKRCRALLDK